jgi:predicted secreted protein
LLLGIGIVVAASSSAPTIKVIDDGSATASVWVPLAAELEVELGANPTTGYTWRLMTGDLSKLRFKSRRYRPIGSGNTAGSPLRLGAGGVDVFAFVPVLAGTEHLRFEYRRGQAGEPARSYDLAVTVSP